MIYTEKTHNWIYICLKNIPSPLFAKEGAYSLPLAKEVYPPPAAPKATRGWEVFYKINLVIIMRLLLIMRLVPCVASHGG